MPETDRFVADLAHVTAAYPDARVLIAVSGGPDSMALLTLAAASGRSIAAATVDHRLRAEAGDEAAMVAAHCARIGVGHTTLIPGVPIAGASIQAQARTTRYALLADHARDIGAPCIATGHHADDQAETFLMRAARGAGLSGLAGIRGVVEIEGVAVVRPLLDWRRAELRAIVRRGEVPFVDDPANADARHDRTRFRHLLDANEWLDSPRLARSAALLAEADADVRATIDWLWAERATVAGTDVRIAVDPLPQELRRRLVRRAITTVRAAADIDVPTWSDAMQIEPLLHALMRSGKATQAGVLASARGDIWRFRPAPARRST